MLTQNESVAPGAVSGTSQKLLQLLRKRLRQLSRVALVLAIGIGMAAAGLAIWWLTSLKGLPDIGDPFDVAAFRASRIADDQNAFTFLERAERKITRYPDVPWNAIVAGFSAPWSKLDPKVQTWVEGHGQALELFQQGAEKSDAMPDLGGDPLAFSGVNLYAINILTLLEAKRRQESGDMAAAWNIYRAILRMTAHVARRRHAHPTRINACCRWLRQQLATWAADPRTTVTQIRVALNEALEARATPEWDSFTLKLGYLEIMRLLDRPMEPFAQQAIEGEWNLRVGDMQVSTDFVDYIEAARRFLLREPDRSRRVVRLLWANCLADVQNREKRPSKPAAYAQLGKTKPVSVPVYPVSADAAAGIRMLPPAELADWLVSSLDARLRLISANSPGSPWPPSRPPNLGYRKAHRELVIMLATEMYRRERGAPPPSEEALVGPYLESLPDDGSSDLADLVTPTVEMRN